MLSRRWWQASLPILAGALLLTGVLAEPNAENYQHIGGFYTSEERTDLSTLREEWRRGDRDARLSLQEFLLQIQARDLLTDIIHDKEKSTRFYYPLTHRGAPVPAGRLETALEESSPHLVAPSFDPRRYGGNFGSLVGSEGEWFFNPEQTRELIPDYYSEYQNNLRAPYAPVWIARTLLRPVQLWSWLHEGQIPSDLTYAAICRDLGFLPNAPEIARLAATFDEAEMYLATTGGAVLTLRLGNEEWTWLATFPAEANPHIFELVLAWTDRADMLGPSPQALGTLDGIAQALPRHEQIALIRELSMGDQQRAMAKSESHALVTLRALGSSQLAYAEQNPDRNFGSWGNMVMTDYIQPGYTRENLIRNYSLAIFHANPGINLGTYSRASRFTIVAMPTRRPGLRTFAICEDQTIRVATDFSLNIRPNVGNNPPVGDSPCEWEPLRR